MWAGVDNAWEQEKPEARKMLLNRADSHTSGARFVRRVLLFKLHTPYNLSDPSPFSLEQNGSHVFTVIVKFTDNCFLLLGTSY